MSVTTLPESVVSPFVPSGPPSVRASITIQEQVTIPAWVVDLQTFLSWAASDEFPETGRFSYLNGEIWVDLSMEELATHNIAKMALAHAIMHVLDRSPIGKFVGDGMLLFNPQVGLSTVPDGLFYFWSTLETKKLVKIQGKSHGHTAFMGSPDLTLEVVSDSSVRKDTITLRDQYWKAGIAEYWLADARGEAPAFEILRRAETGYEPSPVGDGWQKSLLLGHAFRLVRQFDRLGDLDFLVESRPIT